MKPIGAFGLGAILLTAFFWFADVLPFSVQGNGMLVFVTTGIAGMFGGGLFTVTRAVRNRTGISQILGVAATWVILALLYAFAFHAGLGHLG